jgi:Ca-activated chloride channel family protein
VPGRAPPAAAAAAPAGLNLTLVLDRSTSMMGEALDRVKEAALHLVDAMDPSDCLGVVAFSDSAAVLSPGQPLSDRAAVRGAIQALKASGATNIHQALELGRGEAMRNLSAERINRLLLLSDGEATAGNVNDEHIVALADSCRGHGISVSTLGVGEEYDEVLLGHLARRGGGNHYFIERPDEIPGIFDAELARVRAVVAKNVMVRVRPAAGAQVRMLTRRYRCETSAGDFVVYLDEMEAARAQATILDVDVDVPGERPGELRVADLELVYDNLVDRVRSERSSVSVGLTIVTDHSRMRDGINRNVLRRWEELVAMQDLRELVDSLKERRIDARTAVLELDRRTQSLVKRRALEAARAYTAVGRTIREEGGVSTHLSKRTMVACEEAERGPITGRTLLEEG